MFWPLGKEEGRGPGCESPMGISAWLQGSEKESGEREGAERDPTTSGGETGKDKAVQGTFTFYSLSTLFTKTMLPYCLHNSEIC